MSDSSYPTATYRLQFNKDFRLSDATALIDYFSDLGISDIYASPVLGSRKGSQHGYDVTDATNIDPEIGTAQEFANFQNELLKKGMRLILDIVPNHMAASSENRWWMDVLENGFESRFASYFDIDWHPPSKTLNGKVLLPVLGRSFGEVLDRGELILTFQDTKFFIQYFESIFPLAVSTYHRILAHRLEELKNLLPEESAAYQDFLGIISGLSAGSPIASGASQTDAERRVRTDAIRERLQALVANSPGIVKFIANNVADLNGRSGDPASRCQLEQLLREQNFRLAYWLDPNEGINYRRFFAISDLVGVRVEDPLVFEATHDRILHIATGDAIRGLRVDHIDGLRDPVGYLNRLHDRLCASKPPETCYPIILVEKILSSEESLPEDWQISGTTGYEYMNAANGVFVDPAGAKKLGAGYLKFIGKDVKFADIVYQKKKLVMNTLLRVEMRSLGRQLADLAADDRYARNLMRKELMDVLFEVTACFPVYRTYIRNLEVSASSKQLVKRAIAEARKRRPRLSRECFTFLHDVLTVENLPHILANQREERLAFVMRWQQFTGPIVAKGVEDTALYVYYPLLSLDEVGGSPDPGKVYSRAKFFDFIQERQRRWPDTLNATSTHDTKRSEDVRARVNVLSEIPDEWISKVEQWSRDNEAQKQLLDGRKVPDTNEEYLIYQTLIGLWPADRKELPALCERLQAYIVKAIREAMVHTRWTEPNVPHEKAICEFIGRILLSGDDGSFISDVARFQQEIGYAGMLNALAQTLLKIACPGVPDFYQGSELWDYHLVDPDNRTSIDYQIRRSALRALTERAGGDSAQIAKELLDSWPDGRIKQFVIWKALRCRRSHPVLFREGQCFPLEIAGDLSDRLIAFERRHGDDRMIAIVPRWTLSSATRSDRALETPNWKDNRILLPIESAQSWRNIFTRSVVKTETIDQRRQKLAVSNVLSGFPVALLIPSEDGKDGSES